MSTQLEELLDRTIGPDADPTATTADGWEAITTTVRRRHGIRVLTMRLSIAAFLGLCGMAALLSTAGRGLDTTVPLNPANSTSGAAEVRWWPTDIDRLEQWSAQPASHWWLQYLIGLGIPAIVGWRRWFLVPAHVRMPLRSQRWARVGVGLYGVMSAALVIVIVSGIGLFFVYDPLAIAMDNSVTMSVAVVAGWCWLVAGALSIFAMFQSVADPGFWRAAWTFLALSVAANIVAQVSQVVSRTMVLWDQVFTDSPVDPPRGLRHSLLGGQQLGGLEGSSQQVLAWLGLGLLLMIGVGGWRFTRGLARAVAADGAAPSGIADGLERVSLRSVVGAGLLILGLAVPASLYLPVAQAVNATMGEVPVLEDWRTEDQTNLHWFPDPWAVLSSRKLGGAALNEGELNIMRDALEARGFVPHAGQEGELRRSSADGGDAQRLILQERSDPAFGSQLWVGAGVFDNDGVSTAQLLLLPGLAAAVAGGSLLWRRRPDGEQPPIAGRPATGSDLSTAVFMAGAVLSLAAILVTYQQLVARPADNLEAELRGMQIGSVQVVDRGSIFGWDPQLRARVVPDADGPRFDAVAESLERHSYRRVAPESPLVPVWWNTAEGPGPRWEVNPSVAGTDVIAENSGFDGREVFGPLVILFGGGAMVLATMARRRWAISRGTGLLPPVETRAAQWVGAPLLLLGLSASAVVVRAGLEVRHLMASHQERFGDLSGVSAMELSGLYANGSAAEKLLSARLAEIYTVYPFGLGPLFLAGAMTIVGWLMAARGGWRLAGAAALVAALTLMVVVVGDEMGIALDILE